eukprot:TRINITY_DN8292_c1_g1_i1.p1 TRINITY_DN8292_c1_g1~~TRINITY_DN8292_c1_g1_i1.p1  ORF type:complete len:110 (+),score=10.33 TRINITY_DN8292_c1_g1_i1:768-1097(+)
MLEALENNCSERAMEDSIEFRICMTDYLGVILTLQLDNGFSLVAFGIVPSWYMKSPWPSTKCLRWKDQPMSFPFNLMGIMSHFSIVLIYRRNYEEKRILGRNSAKLSNY